VFYLAKSLALNVRGVPAPRTHMQVALTPRQELDTRRRIRVEIPRIASIQCLCPNLQNGCWLPSPSHFQSKLMLPGLQHISKVM
jgi:hypothetical protein